ncbi:MAG: SnoaL-like domain-containing protein [Chloroflexi bacterium]|jgi:acyl dehydratase|nr:SnoaL-like domain-containing protein [Chloroflexota bacterium]
MRYFEDIELHHKEIFGSYSVTKEEIIEFAKKWDPQPFHIDEEAAAKSIYGGITAPSTYTIAVCHSFTTYWDPPVAWMGALGWQDVEFPNPVRPGDVLSIVGECIERRGSRSKYDRGILRFLIVMTNQNGKAVLSFKTKAMVARNPDLVGARTVKKSVAEEAMNAYFELYSSGDYEKTVDTYYTDDIVFEFPGGKYVGKEAVLNYFVKLHDGLKEIMKPRSLLIGSDRIAAELEITFEAEKDAPHFLGKDKTLKAGQSFTAINSVFYDIQDEKIRHVKIYRP